MSHVAVQETRAGEPMYRDIACLQRAAEMLGGELVQKKDYTWYGRHVGDYPMPVGMKSSDLGHNALWVFRLCGEKYAEAKAKHGGEPYEIGFVEDPNNPGCLMPIYDFFAGGYGLSEAVGEPIFEDRHGRQVRMLCPKLKQYYDMACDAAAAQGAGDSIEFLTLADAHDKYPQLFPEKTTDKDTWVSIAQTEQRIGVS